MSIYQDEGYENRRAYLMGLADDFGLDPREVFAMASVLGSSEDFDGLVCACEDRADELAHAERPDRPCDASCSRRLHGMAPCDCSRAE
jgi:hypothetical protein